MPRIREIDKSISVLGEEVARRVSRRVAVSKAIGSVTGVAAALSLGSLVKPSTGWAGGCTCNWIRRCSEIGYTCPGTTQACPVGCQICYQGDCSECPYPSGSWVSCNCGPGGAGAKLCYDCFCFGCGGGTCTCLTSCICGGCRSPQDVVQYMAENGLLPPG